MSSAVSSPVRPRRAEVVEAPASWAHRAVDVANSRLPLVVALAVVAIVHGVNVAGWPGYGDDEGTYVAQAWAVLHGELAHYTYWYDHPPFGWVQLAAFLAPMRLLGVEPSVAAMRPVMVVYSLVTAYLLYRLGRNLGLERITAVAVILLWAVSPLTVYEARQVLLDSLQLPWLLGGFVLGTRRKGSLWSHVLAGICFGCGVLTKETGLLLLPALLLAIWRTTYRRTRWFSLVGFLVSLGCTGSFYLVLAALKGELFPGAGHVSLWDGVVFQLGGRTGSGVLWDPTSAAQNIVKFWLSLDPLLPVAGLVGALACVSVPRLRCIGLSVLIYDVMGVRPNGYLPAMYITGSLPFCALAFVGAAEALMKRCTPWLTRHLTVRHLGWIAISLPVAVAVYATSSTLQQNRLAAAWHDQDNRNYNEAIGWVDDHLSRSTRILVDDTYWTPIVDAGWSSDGWSGPIWYYKLDLDPLGRAKHLPGGWREVDYVIANAQVRSAMDTSTPPPLLCQDMFNSAVVTSFGTGNNRVEVRKVSQDAAAAKSCPTS